MSGALRGGMPLYKYIANRALTAVQNALLGVSLSEYHTGYRTYAREVLLALPLHENSDDFVFDNQILAQAIYFGYRRRNLVPDPLLRGSLFHLACAVYSLRVGRAANERCVRAASLGSTALASVQPRGKASDPDAPLR